MSGKFNKYYDKLRLKYSSPRFRRGPHSIREWMRSWQSKRSIPRSEYEIHGQYSWYELDLGAERNFRCDKCHKTYRQTTWGYGGRCPKCKLIRR